MIGLDDIGMNQVSDELGFADEVFDEAFLGGEILANDFHRDALHEVARAVLFGFVNNSHSALEDLPDDFIPELALDGEQRGHFPDVLKTAVQVKPEIQKTDAANAVL